MDSDEEDFVFHGTPIEREEGASSRKKKALAEASGNLRSLPAWKQEVTLTPFRAFLRVAPSEYFGNMWERGPRIRSLCALPAFHIGEVSRNDVHQLFGFLLVAMRIVGEGRLD